MKLLIWFPVLLMIAIVSSSCIPDPLEVEGIPKVKPEIVVTSQIIPDQSLVVLLTKCLKEVLRDDDIAKDAFVAVSTKPVIWASRSNQPWS